MRIKSNRTPSLSYYLKAYETLVVFEKIQEISPETQQIQAVNYLRKTPIAKNNQSGYFSTNNQGTRISFGKFGFLRVNFFFRQTSRGLRAPSVRETRRQNYLKRFRKENSEIHTFENVNKHFI